MYFRITLAETIYYTCDTLAEAQSEALDHARELTRAVGEPVRVTVHKMGHGVIDDLGRDVTPAFFIGTAIGRIERSNAFVSWIAAPKVAVASTKRRLVVA